MPYGSNSVQTTSFSPPSRPTRRPSKLHPQRFCMPIVHLVPSSACRPFPSLPSHSSLCSLPAAHIKLESYGSAIEDATKAIELDPTYVKVAALPLRVFSLLSRSTFARFVVGLHGRSRGQRRRLAPLLLFFATQAYYRRGSASLALRKFKDSLRDFKEVYHASSSPSSSPSSTTTTT